MTTKQIIILAGLLFLACTIATATIAAAGYAAWHSTRPAPSPVIDWRATLVLPRAGDVLEFSGDEDSTARFTAKNSGVALVWSEAESTAGGKCQISVVDAAGRLVMPLVDSAGVSDRKTVMPIHAGDYQLIVSGCRGWGVKIALP